MGELGQFALRLGLFLSGYAILIDLLGLWRGRNELLKSGRNATIGSLLCLTAATVSLWVLLVQGEFAVSYVAEHTSRTLPLAYKLTALWAGAAGSLLFWLWLQTGFVVLAFSRSGRAGERFCAGARAAANLVATFFFLVLIFDKDPFASVGCNTARRGGPQSAFAASCHGSASAGPVYRVCRLGDSVCVGDGRAQAERSGRGGAPCSIGPGIGRCWLGYS